jgi:hypothetical protein
VISGWAGRYRCPGAAARYSSSPVVEVLNPAKARSSRVSAAAISRTSADRALVFNAFKRLRVSPGLLAQRCLTAASHILGLTRG